MFHSCPHINQTLPQILDILHFPLVDSLLNYASECAVNWIEVMAVRQPQIWRHEYMAVVFSQLLCMASLQIFQTKIVYNTHKTGRNSSVSISGKVWHVEQWVYGRPSWLPVSYFTATTCSSVCLHILACQCHVWSVFHVFAAYTVMHQVVPLPGVLALEG